MKEIPPLKYPKRAVRLGVEGYVDLRFDLSANGEIIDLRVVDSKPRRMFDKSAMQFVSAMEFSPAEEGGEPVLARDAKLKVTFKL